MAVQTSSTSLPFFAPNQILRADDLNNLVNILETQNRLSRVFSIGIGIISGYNVDIQLEDPAPDPPEIARVLIISISAGLGISSDGYLFQLEACDLEYVSEVTVSKNVFRLVNNESLRYNPEIDPINVCELKAEEELLPEDGFEPVSDKLYQGCCGGKVLVLVWYKETVGRKACFNDCNERGADQFFRVRKFLVDKDKYLAIVGQQEGGEGQEPSTITLSTIPYIRRFGFFADSDEYTPPYEGDPDVFNLCDISTWYRFYKNFWLRSSEAISSIYAAYRDADLEFGQKVEGFTSGVFDSLQDELNSLLDLFPDPDNGGVLPNLSDIQYLHDYLKDLVLAYWEFESMANGLTVVETDQSSRDLSQFPGHIALGFIKIPGVDNDNCEGGFPAEFFKECLSDAQFANYNPSNFELLEKAKCLYQRMIDLARTTSSLRLPTLNGKAAKLTPSCRDKYLSQRAVPFYYNLERVQKCWDPVLRRGEQYTRIPSYSRESQNPPFDYHLRYDLDKYTFFRIEGFLGFKLDKAIDDIDVLRKQFNVPFDIQSVYLGPSLLDLSQENDLYFEDLDRLFLKTVNDLICKLLELQQAQDTAVNQGAIQPLLDFLDQENMEILASFHRRYEEFKVLYEAVFPAGTEMEECCRESLESLKDAYQERLEEIEKSLSFAGFSEKHPGMEHRAGVMKGGTFILVYAFHLTNDARISLSLSQLSYLEGIASMSDEEVITAILESENPDSDYITFIKSKVNHKKIVVGDFCLPYYCCSKAPVIRNEIKRIKVSISLGKTKFCSNEQDSFPLTGFPLGGAFNAEPDSGLDISDPDQSYFVPSQVTGFENGKAEIMLSYSIGGETAEIKVIVYEMPDLDAVDILCENQQPLCGDLALGEDPNVTVGYKYDLRFDNLPENAYEYLEWRRSDGSLIGTTNPQLGFEVRFAEAPLEVVLFVRNGVCEGETPPKTIEPCPDMDTLTFELIQEVVDPATGEITDNPLEQFDQATVQIAASEIPTRIRIEPSTVGGKLTAIRRFEDGTEADRPVAQQGCPDTVYHFDLNEQPVVGQVEEITYELAYQFQGCEGSNVFTIRVVLGQIIIPDRLCTGQGDIPLSATPSGGTFDMSPAYIGGTADAPVFKPSAVIGFVGGQVQVEVKYTPPEGDVITEKVTVIQQTIARFNLESSGPRPDYDGNCQFNGLIYRLTSDSDNYDLLNWNIPAGTNILNNGTVNSQIIDLHVPPGVVGNVSLYAENTENGCPPNTSAPLRLTGCPEAITFNIDGTVFDPGAGTSFVVQADTVIPTPVAIKPIPNGGLLTVTRIVTFTSGDSETVPITNIEINPEATCAETTYSVPVVNLQGTNIQGVEYVVTYDLNICGSVSFRINVTSLILRPTPSPGEEGRPTEPESPLAAGRTRSITPPGAVTLLNQRQAAYRAIVGHQGQDASLANTKSYKLAELFLSFRGGEAELNARFEEAVGTLASSAKRATGERRKQYQELIAAVTYSYLDKLVAETGEAISGEARAAIQAQADKMKQAEMNLSQLKRGWKGSELEKTIDTKAVGQINRLLK